MARAYGGVVALALAVHTAAEAAGISLQLHRHPGPVPRYDTYQRRRLKGEGEPFESVPLNLGMGTHYAWVYAGTPPQRASVIADTGSSIMAFPCSECTGCGNHTDPRFVESNSSTLTHVTCTDQGHFFCQGCGGMDSAKKTCEISQSYMEGSSWHATVVEDIVYLGGANSYRDTSMRDTYGTHFKFGCQVSATGLFISQVADGIMGLANNDHHLVAKLYNEKKIPNKLFSLCFAQDGGSMSIGAPDVSRHKGEISYAKLVKTVGHDFYGVELRDVRIGGASIDPPKTSLEFGRYIVDSGTTDSYLPSSMRQAFQAAFKKASGFDYHVSSSLCQGYSEKDISKLPNVELVLGAEDGGNLTLVVTPDQYLLQEANGKLCSGIFLSESSGGVIGANIMMDHDVIFDQGKQRVGFVSADCDYNSVPRSGIPPANLTTPSTSSPPSTSPSPSAVVAEPSPSPSVATAVPDTTAPAVAVVTDAPEPTEAITPAVKSSAPTATEASPSVTPSADSPTTKPSQAPLPAATTEAPQPTPTESPQTTKPAATSTSPTPTSGESEVKDGISTAADTSTESEEEHPIVLTIVGTVLAVAFILVAVLSVRRHKKTKREKKWRRVKETDGDEDDADDDEEELMEHTPGQKKGGASRSDAFEDDDGEDDDDDENIRPDRQLGVADSDEDDDDDEIFEKDTVDHDEHKHDTRMLEQL